MDDNIKNLGPLAALAGVWEGDKGDDKAPDDDRVSVEHNLFRERMTFEPIGVSSTCQSVVPSDIVFTAMFPIGVSKLRSVLDFGRL
jgi:hypothetical protein